MSHLDGGNLTRTLAHSSHAQLEKAAKRAQKTGKDKKKERAGIKDRSGAGFKTKKKYKRRK